MYKNLTLMLTLDVCKEILNTGDRTYTNEEVKQIREYLYLLASLQMEAYEIQENKQITKEEDECNTILSS